MQSTSLKIPHLLLILQFEILELSSSILHNRAVSLPSDINMTSNIIFTSPILLTTLQLPRKFVKPYPN
jgi:hypothetical protein